MDNLSENVKRGIRQKLRNGVWPKHAPLGYLNNPKTKNVDVDQENAKFIKKAFELFATQRKSFTQIAEFLYKCGIEKKNRWRVKNRSNKKRVDQYFLYRHV